MARRPKRPAGTPALAALGAAGVEFAAHPYEHDPRSELSFGVEAAEALGVEPARVFKTLLTTVDGGLVVAVVPVAGQLDLKALAAACHGKRAAMADPDAAERSTGYVVGGMSPLGQRSTLPTVIDETAHEHATIFVSAGRRGLDVELAPADLVRLTDATVAPIGREGRTPHASGR